MWHSGPRLSTGSTGSTCCSEGEELCQPMPVSWEFVDLTIYQRLTSNHGHFYAIFSQIQNMFLFWILFLSAVYCLSICWWVFPGEFDASECASHLGAIRVPRPTETVVMVRVSLFRCVNVALFLSCHVCDAPCCARPILGISSFVEEACLQLFLVVVCVYLVYQCISVYLCIHEN